jgi:hypothetical protein
MSVDGPLGLVTRIAQLLEELDIPYAIGGSVAASFFGEPRATADVDVAILVSAPVGEELLRRVAAEFYVPTDAARRAIRGHDSFNLVANDGGLKVDLFVLGPGLLDRRQIERRILVLVTLDGPEIWITSPEDQILRKLSWYRATGSTSERQWRDVIGLLRVSQDRLDQDYLSSTAEEVGLDDLLTAAIAAAANEDAD